jgi:hypothetical protein
MLKQADTAHEASQALCILMQGEADANESAKKIRELEHRGDQLVRDVYRALHTTFIVPIDHSDISQLAGALDDVTDIIDHTAAAVFIYKIQKPTPAMVRLAELLVQQTGELQKAVVAVSNGSTYRTAAQHCNEIKRLETEADELYDSAVGKLFEGKDPIEIIKQKEILFCLETATDRVDKAAHTIADITLKHA